MNIQRFLLLFVVFCWPAMNYVHAQTVVIVQERVSLSRTLAGHVNVGLANEPASAITVELCSPDWQTVFASTKTDGHGYFSLERRNAGKMFYIRLSAPGINPYQLRVRIRKHGPPELTIHLSVAT